MLRTILLCPVEPPAFALTPHEWGACFAALLLFAAWFGVVRMTVNMATRGRSRRRPHDF